MKKEDNVTEGKYTLEYTEFENFLPTKAEKVITTHELAKKLNARLKPAFQDYRGCFIAPNPNGVLTVMIQFNQLRENQIQDNGIATAFKAVESMRGVGNIADRSRALSMVQSLLLLMKQSRHLVHSSLTEKTRSTGRMYQVSHIREMALPRKDIATFLE